MLCVHESFLAVNVATHSTLRLAGCENSKLLCPSVQQLFEERRWIPEIVGGFLQEQSHVNSAYIQLIFKFLVSDTVTIRQEEFATPLLDRATQTLIKFGGKLQTEFSTRFGVPNELWCFALAVIHLQHGIRALFLQHNGQGVREEPLNQRN